MLTQVPTPAQPVLWETGKPPALYLYMVSALMSPNHTSLEPRVEVLTVELQVKPHAPATQLGKGKTKGWEKWGAGVAS